MRLLHWLARRLRAFVERYDPVTHTPAPAQALPAGASRFQVLRNLDGASWTLYDGPRGAEARQQWEHVKSHHERGTMRFMHNGVQRDFYSHD